MSSPQPKCLKTTHVSSPKVSPKSLTHHRFVLPSPTRESSCPGCAESTPEKHYNELHAVSDDIDQLRDLIHRADKDKSRLLARLKILRLQRSAGSRPSAAQKSQQILETQSKIKVLEKNIELYEEQKVDLKKREEVLRVLWGQDFAEKMEWDDEGLDVYKGDLAVYREMLAASDYGATR